MRIYIMGIDGYIGWALAQYLAARGHLVAGCDNLLKRRIAKEMGTTPIIPIDFDQRKHVMDIDRVDAKDDTLFKRFLERFEPDAIVNLAQIPSAPYSQVDQSAAYRTQVNNLGTNLSALWFLKDARHVHLVQLGTMGEYGTPNVDIPEGAFDLEFRGRTDRCQFPRKPGSFYHCSKVHASVNCEYACRAWGLTVTDIMQGVVYGVEAPGSRLPTSFYVDECFGTVINRFCAQAVIGHPLTVYGNGSQTRGYLPLRDSLQCIELLCLNPPAPGEYRVVNQFDQSYSVHELARIVSGVYEEMGHERPATTEYPNPRVEAEDHYYHPDHSILQQIGYVPYGDISEEVRSIVSSILPYKETIESLAHLLPPKTKW